MLAPLLRRFHRFRRPRHASRPADSDALPSPDTAREACTVARLRAEPWYVDSVTIDGTRVRAAGWSMPVADRAPHEGWFTINGRPFDRIAYPLPRADVAAVFWQREGAALCGFECEIDDAGEPYPSGVMEIRRVIPSTPRIELGRDSWFIPDPARHANLPDAERRFRVIGDRDARGFLVSGATDYQRIDRVLYEVAGRHLHQFAGVLDWGVGCGRIARHFPAAHARALTGCDIDRDNVDWCAANLPGSYAASRLVPPLPFESASFDVVSGVSVFTHMREPMQLAWLAELARVLRPGGFLLTTTHGETAIDFARLSPLEYRQTRERVAREGLVVTGNNTQLDGHADHEGEYVNVYHSADYVERTWRRHFDVLHVVPGIILHHDLIVMRTP
jgi:SAM-dependent methyltransferase